MADAFRRMRYLYARSKRDKDSLHERWRVFYTAVHEPKLYRAALPGSATLAKPRVNEIYPIASSMTGWVGDQRPTLFVSPGVDNHSTDFFVAAVPLAADLQNVLEYNLRTNKFEMELEKEAWDAITYGTAFNKITWDETLEDGAGDAVSRRVDPWFMYTDPLATSSDTCSFWIEKRVISRWEAVQRYGDIASDLPTGDIDTMARPSQTERTGTPRTPLALTGNIAGQPTIWPDSATDYPQGWDDEDIVTVMESWYLDDEGWMFCPWGFDRTLAEPTRASEIYEHGRHPYSRWVWQETGEFWGPSLVDYLLNPQDALNDMLFHTVNNLRLAGDPIWLEDERAGTDRQSLRARPGMRVKKQPGGEVSWMVPPQLPPATLQMMQFWVNEMERISGLSGVARGQQPQGRQSQGMVESTQESGFVRVRSALRGLEFHMAEIGNLLASIITKEYTTPRMVAIVGPQGAQGIMALKEKHFYSSNTLPANPDSPDANLLTPANLEDVPLKFTIWVESGSSLPTTKAQRAAQAQSLFAMGALDLQGLFEVLQIPGWQQILARIQQEKAVGTFAPPPNRQRARA